jgi:hypothetical protein
MGRKFNAKEVPMDHMNVEGLAEPVARSLEAMVQAVREQLAKD